MLSKLCLRKLLVGLTRVFYLAEPKPTVQGSDPDATTVLTLKNSILDRLKPPSPLLTDKTVNIINIIRKI